MRKIIAGVLSVILIWMTVPPAPTCGEDINLFINSDFEMLAPNENGRMIAADWGFWDKYWTDVTDENPQSGNSCIRIRNDSDNRSPRISQTIPAVSSENIYTASYHVRAPQSLRGSGAFSFNFQYFDAEGNEMPLVSGKVLTSYPGTNWEKQEITFHVPENAVKVLVYLQLSAIGEVYVDNVFFGIQSKKSDFTIDSDAVFYYDDHTSSPSITVTDKGESGASAVFTLKKGEEVIISETTAEFKNGKAGFSFPLTKISSYLEAYTVSAVVRKTSGETEVLSRDVYKVKRPSRIAKDGTYRKKDGTVFVPVIGYHVNVPENLALPSQDHFRKAKQLGINVVTLSYWYAENDQFETRLLPAIQKAHDNNLMVIVALYRKMLPGGHAYNLENTIKIVKKLADHEDVFAFTLMDEPLLHDRANPESTMLPGYLTVRKYSDSIPVLTVDFRGNVHDYKRVSNFSDVVMADAYPASVASEGKQFSFVGNNVGMLMEAVKAGERVAYSLVQAFNYSDYGYFPTAAEIMHFIYQSLFAGAKGIGYYSISDADSVTDDETGEKTDVPLFKTDRWDELVKRGTGELNACLKAFIENKGENVTDLSDEGFHAASWKDGEEEYLLLINRENEKKWAEVQVGDTAFFTASYGKEVTWGADDGFLRYPLSEGEAVLLTILREIPITLYNAENEPADVLLSGEDMMLEITLPPLKSDSRIFVAIYDGENKELVALCSCEAFENSQMTTETIKFHVPDVKNPYYKVFWWDTLAPKLN